MRKHNKETSVDNVLNNVEPEKKSKRGHPINNNIQHGDPVRERLPYGYRRVTFHLREDLIPQIQNMAYTKRERIQDLANRYIADGLKHDEEALLAAGEKIQIKPDRVPITSPGVRRNVNEDEDNG